jgi:hypothetical protein
MKSIVLDMMKFNFIPFLLIIFVLELSAQTKNEKESRIQLSEFPTQAQTTIHSIIKEVRRIRHYKETDGNLESFESKFKYKKHWYSVEFNKSGELEDIEVRIREDHLNTVVKNMIKSYLNDHFLKYDIIKIQEQYSSSRTAHTQLFLKTILENRKSIDSNFEIIIAVKSSEGWDLKELTFNKTGEFLKTRDIQQESYEYIMY